jgi:hypothetical protein
MQLSDITSGELPQRHTDFFADQNCNGELVRVVEGIYWCQVCGTEFRYVAGSPWVITIYPRVTQ